MHTPRHLSRSLALLATTILVGVLGLSLSVTAFGQDPPLSDYTSTVPTPPAPTTTEEEPEPTPEPSPTTTEEATPPAVEAQPQQASESAPAASTAPAPKKLAFTGFDVVPLLLVGAGLMGLGATLLVRRRGEE